MRRVVIGTALIGFTCAAAADASTLTRDRDPVVLTGTDLPDLLGAAVDRVVAFRYAGGWTQIPVQIDERRIVDYGVVYNLGVQGITTLAYADPNTYTGADPDPAFDANDELAFMARDAGNQAPPDAVEPVGVVSGTGLELEISDPLDGGVGYVYLFRTNGALDASAGQDYVSYQFQLLAGPYIPNYDTMSGPNPENSVAQSAQYRVHFSDRWIRDEINVTAGGASAVDILDRHKNLFGPGNCQRTEDTFSNGEGAFFVNKDGPVRALRSYMGANSGPLTQRTHIFYEQREDVVTHLRVHLIPGVMDLFDYSPDAVGATYYNDLNLGGVPVDGVPDSVATGLLTWEMITGMQGTLVMASWLDTDVVGLVPTSYYSDDSTPTVTQCTGDAFEYATSGSWIDQTIPNTDPMLGPAARFVGWRIIYYEPPNQSTALAALRAQQATTPLSVAVAPYTPAPGCVGDADGDLDVDLDDLTIVLARFGETGTNVPGDVDGDGDVDLDDLTLVLAHFGTTCA